MTEREKIIAYEESITPLSIHDRLDMCEQEIVHLHAQLAEIVKKNKLKDGENKGDIH